MLCYSIPRYGIHKWDLPPVKISLMVLIELLNHSLDATNTKSSATSPVGFRDSDAPFRWFARSINIILDLLLIIISSLSVFFNFIIIYIFYIICRLILEGRVLTELKPVVLKDNMKLPASIITQVPTSSH